MDPEDKGIVEVEVDDLQEAIQALDSDWFATHPGVDYNVRLAYPDEFEMAGHPEYKGLVLVYVVGKGARLRKTVATLDEAIDFMVRYESHQSDA